MLKILVAVQFKCFGFQIRTIFAISDLNSRKVSKGECYIVIWDRDLVKVVKAAQEVNLEIGMDIGIISYNDTPLKKVVANGITTISTDFVAMDKTLAQLVMSKKQLN